MTALDRPRTDASDAEPARDAQTAGAGGLDSVRRAVGWSVPIVGQLLQATVTLVAASAVVWVLAAFAPVDPAQRVLASRGIRSPGPEQLAEVRHELGLDGGVFERYWGWLSDVLRGDLGMSYITGRPVTVEVVERIGPTFVLAGTALCMVLLAAGLLGLAAVVFHDGLMDSAIRALTIVCAAVPSFIVALVFIQVFVIRLGVGVALADGSLAQVILPAACVAISAVAVPTRVLRGSLLSVLDLRYALVARGRGGSRAYIVFRHALPNSIIPFLHAMALAAAWMIGGTVVVEAVFNWPGVGSYLVDAVQAGDLPVIQAIVLLATASYIAASLVADTATALIDPRTRRGP